MLTVFIFIVMLTGVTLAVIYNTKYRNHPWDIYYPKLAWMRAGMYFCVCYTLSYFTGAMELILTSPIVTAGQLDNPNWVWFTVGITVFIVGAYSILWSYFTPVFERKSNRLTSALFGFLWGSSSGQLFLSIWILAGYLPVPPWGSAVVTFLIAAMYQPNWHNIYWDHYIAPEHDTPLTQVIKATCCHIPNLAILLTYLTFYENYLIFVLAQVAACMSAGLGMRYPAPWVEPSKLNYAVRTNARIPRCTGYISENPKTDPYTPFYPGWKGPAASVANTAAPDAGQA
jgi:hypothetical protein